VGAEELALLLLWLLLAGAEDVAGALLEGDETDADEVDATLEVGGVDGAGMTLLDGGALVGVFEPEDAAAEEGVDDVRVGLELDAAELEEEDPVSLADDAALACLFQFPSARLWIAIGLRGVPACLYMDGRE